MTEKKQPLVAHVYTYIDERRLVWFREDLYVYDPQRGVYVLGEESIVRQELLTHLSNWFPPKEINATLVTRALQLAKDLSALPGHLEPPFWRTSLKPARVVVARNGIVDLEIDPMDGKWALRPHTPDLFAVGDIGYHYTPEATCPRFDSFLAQLTGNDPSIVDLILRFYAQAFNRTGYRAEALLWIYGHGGNGKSTMCHVLRHVLGEALTSAVDLQAFSSPASFRLWPLVHSTANFSFDAQLDSKTSITALNTWVSGDGVTIDRKFKRPITIRPKTLLTVASNREPLADDHSDAFWRRIRPIKCPNQVSADQIDPLLEERLQAEAAGILNRLLAFVPIIEREPLMPVPPATQRVIDDLRQQVGSFALFVADEIEESANDHVARDDLMDAFRDWCRRNCVQPVGIPEVKAKMLRLFNSTMRRLRKGHEGRRIQVWSGVRWRRDPDDLDDEAVTEHGLSRRPVRHSPKSSLSWLKRPEPTNSFKDCHGQSSASTAGPIALTTDQASLERDAGATATFSGEPACHSPPSASPSRGRQRDVSTTSTSMPEGDDGVGEMTEYLFEDDDGQEEFRAHVGQEGVGA